MYLEYGTKVCVLFLFLATYFPVNSQKNCGNLVELDDFEAEEIVMFHNLERVKVQSGEHHHIGPDRASNMLKVKWFNDISEIAKNRLRKCELHSCVTDCDEERRKVGSCNSINLTSGELSSVEGIGHWIVSNAINNFHNLMDEVSVNSSILQSYVPSETYSIITQVFWAESWKIGCAASVIPSEDAEKHIKLLLCMYCPAGNIRDKPVFKFGSPCTECPENFRECDATSVDETVTGLCTGSISVSTETDSGYNTGSTSAGVETQYQRKAYLLTASLTFLELLLLL